MRAAGSEWTVLKFNVLLRPGLPAPQSLIDEQLRDSAMDAGTSIHHRAQGSKDMPPFVPDEAPGGVAVPAMMLVVVSPLLLPPWTLGRHNWDQRNSQREVVVQTILRF